MAKFLRNFAMKKIIIFDFDGVIADSLGIYSKLFIDTCKKHGFNQISSKEQFISLFEKNLYESMIEIGIPENEIPKILEDKKLVALKNQDKIKLFDDMKDVIKELSKNNKIFIITSNITKVVEDFLKAKGINFYEEVLGADKGLSKVKKIMDIKSKYKADEYFYIGDTKGDMIEGKKAGVKTIAITWGWHSLEKLNEGLPDFVVHEPKELLSLF